MKFAHNNQIQPIPKALRAFRSADLRRQARQYESELEYRLKVKELIKLIQADGWILTRTRGSHQQYKHPTKLGTVTVSGKPNVDIPPGTLNSALKQAGLKQRGNNNGVHCSS